MPKKTPSAPTLEELQENLDDALSRLAEALKTGSDEDVSNWDARVRAYEQAINDAYYSRWNCP